MKRFVNPHTGMFDPTTDWGALNAGLVKFFLSVEVEAETPQMQGAVGKRKVYIKSSQGDDGEKRDKATYVGLKYMVEIPGLTREMLNDYFVKAGMKAASLKKHFHKSKDGFLYVFGVRDTVRESLENADDRIQAIDNFEKDFNISETDGQYKVTVKEDATDAAGSEIAETVQSLLNIAKTVVKDWRRDTVQDHGGAEGDDKEKPPGKNGDRQPKKRKRVTPLEELAKTLSFPRDECESDDWILAENIKKPKTPTLRTRRSEGERITLNDESVLGRDPQGRVWWKPEEGSQKVFYNEKTLPQPVTRPAKGPSKTTRKK